MRKIFLLILIILSTSRILAQESCSSLIESMPMLAENCAEADSLCLLNISADKEVETQIIRLEDYITDNETIETLATDESQSLALLHLPLNEEVLTLIAYGNTRLENTVAHTEIDVLAVRGVNLRQTPSVASSVIASLQQGETYTAIGRLEDNIWVQVRLETGQIGWVSAQYLKTDTGFAKLSIVSPNTPAYIPMQAFNLETKDDCSGLLLIAPENDTLYELSINDLIVQIQGASIVSQAANMITVAALTGETTVKAFGFEQIAHEGQFISTPISESGKLAGIPNEARTYEGLLLPYELFSPEPNP